MTLVAFALIAAAITVAYRISAEQRVRAEVRGNLFR